MDNTLLDEYMTLLQSTTSMINYYSRELQNYSSLFKKLGIKLFDQQFKDVEKLILNTNNSCNKLDLQIQDVVSALQDILNQAEAPKR